MGFTDAIGTCFSKYVTFRGRARRSEYWYFILFGFIASIGAAIIGAVTGGGNSIGSLITLALFLPNLAVTIRRLHDTNHSGFWLLGFFGAVVAAFAFAGLTGGFSADNPKPGIFFSAALVVVVVEIWLLLLMIRKGTAGTNAFGPDPLATNAADEFN